MASVDDDTPCAYNELVGKRLRGIRRQKQLSLQQVETQSGEEFKASELGAYERGDRALSVPRLDRLAQFYNVPIEQLLPRDVTGAEAIAIDAPTNNPLAIDIAKLMQLTGSPVEILARYLRLIQIQRQDFNGQVITLRRNDTCAVAADARHPRRPGRRPPRHPRPLVHIIRATVIDRRRCWSCRSRCARHEIRCER